MRSNGAGRIVVLGLLGLLLIYWISTRGGYSDVSDRTYAIASALYSVCNRQESEKLTDIAVLIQSAESNEEISTTEAKILHSIMDLAERGDWKAATVETRRLMEDQVKYPKK
jgi:Mg2+/Co2+ transporter CorC